MAVKLIGRRYLGLSAILLTVLLCLYYANYTILNPGKPPSAQTAEQPLNNRLLPVDAAAPGHEQQQPPPPPPPPISSKKTNHECGLKPASADIDTVGIYSNFEFQPKWMKSREYWDEAMEQRYKSGVSGWSKQPLHVFLIPHSHNDPGWVKTVDMYFHYQTRRILNNLVEKLTQHRNMTFIWTEVSLLSKWWESAHPFKRQALRRLIAEGRLELLTGGWVMTDEAGPSLFAMLDQLIEGHQWLRTTLGVSPRSGWAIDPFGHGATVPYLLRAAGLDLGTVVQRIHYAWKQWLAVHRQGDFRWRQAWDPKGKLDMLTHNQPFDIYSIKHSCGPHPQVCLKFDFRKVAGEYTEYSDKATPITSSNVRERAELLLEQYGRTGSLFSHNVVLMPLGDDFRYDEPQEWDQQYTNYAKLADYINSRQEIYNAKITFGTPSQYFQEVLRRSGGLNALPTLKGDFFVYSDIFNEGRSAYWSGYFTTRPYMKVLAREVEATLRPTEIAYTLALQASRAANVSVPSLEREFERLVAARRSLALFQHHDAITGTSQQLVMHDYAIRLFAALQHSLELQARALGALLVLPSPPPATAFLLPDVDRESYERLPAKVPLVIPRDSPRTLILFNSLPHPRQEVVRVRVTAYDVRVRGPDGGIVPAQLNPVWNYTARPVAMSRGHFELTFLADLPALAVVRYIVERAPAAAAGRAVVYCAQCQSGNEDLFTIRRIEPGNVQLENHRMRLLFDGTSGFLRAITRKPDGRPVQVALSVAAYMSAQFHNGAYLFSPNPGRGNSPEVEVLAELEATILIISGPISSELVAVYGDTLIHRASVFHGAGAPGEAVFLENELDLGPAPRHGNADIFMRLASEIANGQPPELWHDQNGFQLMRRVKVERIGLEGNYYPATQAALIQDTARRLTLLLNHAQGVSSWEPGWLEVMLDRRSLYDDARGMGEGVIDNRRTATKYWLLLEDIHEIPITTVNSTTGSPPPPAALSALASQLAATLQYPANVFVVEGLDTDRTARLPARVPLITEPFPCDLHLINLRTGHDPIYGQSPGNTALLVLHRQGVDCSVGSSGGPTLCPDGSGAPFKPHTGLAPNLVNITSLKPVTITGLHENGRSITSLHQLDVAPMQLAAVNITFAP